MRKLKKCEMSTNKLNFGNCGFCNWPLEIREKPIFVTQFNAIKEISDRLFSCNHWQFSYIRFASNGKSTFFPSNGNAIFNIYALFFFKAYEKNSIETLTVVGPTPLIVFIQWRIYSKSALERSIPFKIMKFPETSFGSQSTLLNKNFCTKNLHYVKIHFGVASFALTSHTALLSVPVTDSSFVCLCVFVHFIHTLLTHAIFHLVLFVSEKESPDNGVIALVTKHPCKFAES